MVRFWQNITPILLILLISVYTSVVSAEVVVITSSSSTLSQLSKKEVSKIFLRSRKKIAGNTGIEAVDLPLNSAIRDEFYLKSANKTPRQVKYVFTKRIFTGKGRLNKILANEELVKNWVSQGKNRVGYIDAQNVDKRLIVILTLPK